MTLNIILLVLYGSTLLIIALTSQKYADTMENFLVAGRKQKKLLIVASMLASTIGGGITIGTVTKTYNMGSPAFWFIAAGGIAHFLQGWLLSRKVRETEALTMPDMTRKLIGPSVQMLTSAIILVTWTGIATAQFVAAAKVVTSLTGLAHQPAVAIVAAFLIIYTLIGGQKSVLKTDLFQFGVLAIALITTVLYLYIAKTPAQGTISIELFNDHFKFTNLLYYVFVLGGSYFICPMMFSRILSADTAANARKSSFFSGTGMLIFAVVIIAIGLWAKASITDLGGIDPLNLIAKAYTPKLVGALLIFGLLAAILSTADTVLLTAASTLQNDLIKKPSVLGVRIWVVVVGVVGAFIALYQTDIIGIIMKTYNGYTAGIVPALFVAIMFVGKRRMNAPLAFTAIVVGYALGLTGSFMPANSLLSQVFPMVGLASSAAISLLAVLLPSGKKATA